MVINMVMTIYIVGQYVQAVAHYMFTNERQLIVCLQTIEFSFCINTLNHIYAKYITYSCQENRPHLYCRDVISIN